MWHCLCINGLHDTYFCCPRVVRKLIIADATTDINIATALLKILQRCTGIFVAELTLSCTHTHASSSTTWWGLPLDPWVGNPVEVGCWPDCRAPVCMQIWDCVLELGICRGWPRTRGCWHNTPSLSVSLPLCLSLPLSLTQPHRVWCENKGRKRGITGKKRE